MHHLDSDVKTYFSKYKTKKYNFLFQGLPEIEIQTIADMDQIIDDITDDEFNKDERLPYWAEIWPSAIGLSQFLSKQNQLNDKDILELGSGLGLAGITAGLLNNRITFSDYENIALKFSSYNAMLNNIQHFDVQFIDWRDLQLTMTFDIIIAADVIYEKRFLEPVLNSIISLLKPNGIAYLAEPGRHIAQDFFNLLNKKSISLKQYKEIVNFNEQKHSIDIYCIS